MCARALCTRKTIRACARDVGIHCARATAAAERIQNGQADPFAGPIQRRLTRRRRRLTTIRRPDARQRGSRKRRRPSHTLSHLSLTTLFRARGSFQKIRNVLQAAHRPYTPSFYSYSILIYDTIVCGSCSTRTVPLYVVSVRHLSRIAICKLASVRFLFERWLDEW